RKTGAVPVDLEDSPETESAAEFSCAVQNAVRRQQNLGGENLLCGGHWICGSEALQQLIRCSIRPDPINGASPKSATSVGCAIQKPIRSCNQGGGAVTITAGPAE